MTAAFDHPKFGPVARTPDERFAGLEDWKWEPQYADVGDGLRMAYVDANPSGSRPVLLLHGEPTWSYLYRHMIGPIADAGFRVIVPDLIGFGRSDKPVGQDEYTYERHMGWLTALVVDTLDLRDTILFCQDWGGLLGLRLVGEHPERFAGVVASNTMLPTGDHDPGEAFRAWREYAPRHFPLPHPSPRNQPWLARNAWFERLLVPALRERYRRLAAEGDDHLLDALGRAGVDAMELRCDDDVVQVLLGFMQMRKQRSRLAGGAASAAQAAITAGGARELPVA